MQPEAAGNQIPVPVEPWIGGAVRGWAAASEFSGFSRAQIQSLVDGGLVRRFPLGDRGDWMFSRLDLAVALTAKYSEYRKPQQEAGTIAAGEKESQPRLIVQTEPPETGASSSKIWRAGGLDERRAARYLSISNRAFRTLRKQMGWPRKRIRNTKKIVYPKSLIRAFLAGCDDA